MKKKKKQKQQFDGSVAYSFVLKRRLRVEVIDLIRRIIRIERAYDSRQPFMSCLLI